MLTVSPDTLKELARFLEPFNAVFLTFTYCMFFFRPATGMDAGSASAADPAAGLPGQARFGQPGASSSSCCI